MDELGPLFSPLIVYSVKLYRSNKKFSQEYVFIGNLLEKDDLSRLERGLVSSANAKKIFKEFQIEPTAGAIFCPLFLNFYDTWEEIYLKILSETKIDQFYLWSPDRDDILTHEFIYKNKKIVIPASPFVSLDFQEDSEKLMLFKTFTSLKVNSLGKHLVRDKLMPNSRVFNIISSDDLKILYSSDPDQLKRFNFMSNLNLNLHYNIHEALCLDSVLRNFEVNPQVKCSNIHISQCTIHCNYNEDPAYINLETVFQLIPTNHNIFFTKLKIGTRSASKISKNIAKFKDDIPQAQLLEWADPDKHEKGLIYRKIKENKSSKGLVYWSIQNNGFIEVKINWLEKNANQLQALSNKYQIPITKLGKTGGKSLKINDLEISTEELNEAFIETFPKLFG